MLALSCAIVYQLFFRYEYYHYQGNVGRIDKLTGAMCVMPCVPQPVPTDTAPPSPLPSAAFNALFDLNVQRAIRLAQGAQNARSLLSEHPGDLWRNETPNPTVVVGLTQSQVDQVMGATPGWPGPATEAPLPTTFLICLCNVKGIGFRWEAHTDTGEVFYVDDNAELMHKYGITPAK